jgi:hypothetical protein
MAEITGITHGQTVVLEETRVTRYVALEETADGFTIGVPGTHQRRFHPIEFPGVIESASVIFFRTQAYRKANVFD